MTHAALTSAATLAGTMMPLLVGLIAIAGAYWNGTRLERKKAEISLLNDQLGKLCGPLFALNEASRSTWLQFRQRYRPAGSFFDPNDPPSESELAAWRDWMLNVFMPMNERMVETIVSNLHLIEGSKIPQSFLDLIAHVEAYRVVKSRWEHKDFTENVSLLNYPDSLTNDVRGVFDRLK